MTRQAGAYGEQSLTEEMILAGAEKLLVEIGEPAESVERYKRVASDVFTTMLAVCKKQSYRKFAQEDVPCAS